MLRRIGALVVLAGAVVLTTVAPAEAHAALVRSNPYDGEQLSSSPAHIELSFTERPDPALTVVTLADATGRESNLGKVAVASGDPRTVHVMPPQQLGAGVYTVVWRTVSLDDGHPSSGRLAFGVGTPAAPLGASGYAAGTGSSPYGAAARWALIAGLALLLGTAACHLLVAPDLAPPPRVLLVGVLLSVVGVVLTAVGESADADVSIGALLSAGRGAATIRLAAAVAVSCAAALAAVRRPRRLTFALLATGAIAALAARAYAGHAAAPGPLRVGHIGVQTAHLIALGIWMGGLVWLLVALRRADPVPLRRFSMMAATCLAVVVLTGTLRALADLDAPKELLTTGFGRVLLGKLALVGGLALAGLGSRRLVHSGGVEQLRRTVGTEIGLGVVVLGLSAVLGGLAPPGTAVPAPSAPALTTSGQDFGMTLTVHLIATPGWAGVNQLEVHLTGREGNDPVEARRVSVRLALPTRPEIEPTVVELKLLGGAWTASTAVLSVDGKWTANVVVERGADSVEVPLTLELAAGRPSA